MIPHFDKCYRMFPVRRLDDVSDEYPDRVGTAVIADVSSRMAAALPVSLRSLFPVLLWAHKQLASVRPPCPNWSAPS